MSVVQLLGAIAAILTATAALAGVIAGSVRFLLGAVIDPYKVTIADLKLQRDTALRMRDEAIDRAAENAAGFREALKIIGEHQRRTRRYTT